jgi:hypothetical protein
VDYLKRKIRAVSNPVFRVLRFFIAPLLYDQALLPPCSTHRSRSPAFVSKDESPSFRVDPNAAYCWVVGENTPALLLEPVEKYYLHDGRRRAGLRPDPFR